MSRPSTVAARRVAGTVVVAAAAFLTVGSASGSSVSAQQAAHGVDRGSARTTIATTPEAQDGSRTFAARGLCVGQVVGRCLGPTDRRQFAGVSRIVAQVHPGQVVFVAQPRPIDH